MTKVFCPHIAGLCDQGYPGDQKCTLWDADNQVCLFAENLKYSAEAFKRQVRLLPPSVTNIDKMLKEVNPDKEDS